MLDPRADVAVRDAVLAHLRGGPASFGRRPTGGFESRSGSYRVADGTLVLATDPSLIGAELVGFLREDGEPKVRGAWEPASRAVFVHVGRNNQIVLTSATRGGSLVWSAQPGSPAARDGSPSSQRNLHDVRGLPVRPSSPPPRAPSAPPPLPHAHRATRPLPDDPKPPPRPSTALARPAPLPPPKRVGPPPLPAVLPPPPPRGHDWDSLDELVASGGRPSVPPAPLSVDELAQTTPRGSGWVPTSPTSQPFLLSRPAPRHGGDGPPSSR